MKKIFAISGSTRNNSSNHAILRAIRESWKDQFEMRIYDGISGLPHFNPDQAVTNTPPSVIEFREEIRAADGIIICTPEYAHGVPGSLKNAIDWTVHTGEFYQKPTLLITASTDGRFGHQALLETLMVIEAGKIKDLNLLIPFVRTRVAAEGFTDENTEKAVGDLVNKFMKEIVDSTPGD